MTIHTRILSLFVILLSIGLFACGNDDDVSLSFQEQYEERELQVIANLVPALSGTWQLDQLHISYVAHWRQEQQQLGIITDTIFRDVGTLTVGECQGAEPLRYPDCRATLAYQDEDIPLQFELLAAADRVMQDTGVYAYLGLYPDTTATAAGYDYDQPTVNFFRNINIIEASFAIARIDPDNMV